MTIYHVGFSVWTNNDLWIEFTKIYTICGQLCTFPDDFTDHATNNKRKVMLFRFILGIDLLNLPVNLTHFTGTAQNKRAFYFSISSDSPTSNKRNEFAEKNCLYVAKGHAHLCLLQLSRILWIHGKVNNKYFGIYVYVCSKKLSVPSDLFEFCAPENEYISTRVFFFFSVRLW